MSVTAADRARWATAARLGVESHIETTANQLNPIANEVAEGHTDPEAHREALAYLRHLSFRRFHAVNEEREARQALSTH